MKVAVIILSIIALGLAGGGYYLYDTQKKQIEDLTFKVNNLEKEKAALSAELEQKISEISKEKEDEIAKLKTTYDDLVSGMKDEIEQGQIRITQLADRLSVTMVDKILFPSGEAEITPEGLKVLERVGNVLKETQNKIIRVEGHTDNVAIAPRLRSKYASNWELSTARATNVVRFLQEKIGIDPARLHAVGLSEFQPVATNETPEGRSQNRRIEIALLPIAAEQSGQAGK